MELYAHIKPQLAEVESAMEAELSKQDARVYGLLVPFIKRGGKRIRPALALLACGATGGDRKNVLLPASIIELFHNFTLIHDDIEDDSQFRRGEPTLHVTYGISIALNSGDALYTYLWNRLLDVDISPSKLLKLQRLYAETFKRVVDGQGIELSWIKNNRFDVSEAEYLQMIDGKTSALIGLSCEAGAVMANAKSKYRKALRNYGEKIGAAFQIQDDILNLTGEFEKYQKEIGGDISEGKRTLMVVHCLAHAHQEDKKRLEALLSSHTKKSDEIHEAIALLKKYGSIDYARSRAQKLVDTARKSIKTLPESEDKTALLTVAEYVLNRQH